MSCKSGRRSGGVRLFVFDFDQTLSVVHVFKTLAGWADGDNANKGGSKNFRVPAPFATSEEGQVTRIEELSDAEFHEVGGFAQAAFGGELRVAKVRELLRGLKEEGGAELVICTKGLVGAVNKCLHDLDLLRYFGEVYGNVGDNYGMTPYDKRVSEAGILSAAGRQFLGNPEQAGWGTKDKLVKRLMKSRGLGHDQCVLVEDDPEEIRRAEPVCRTLLVKEAAGVTEEHLRELLRLASSGNGAGRGRMLCIVQ